MPHDADDPDGTLREVGQREDVVAGEPQQVGLDMTVVAAQRSPLASLTAAMRGWRESSMSDSVVMGMPERAGMS